MELSLPGAKVRGNESSSYRYMSSFCMLCNFEFSLQKHEFKMAMSCEGCSNAAKRVLAKIGGMNNNCISRVFLMGLWLFRPFAVLPPRRFAPWLVRPRTWYHCDTMTETLCLQPSFHSFPRFSISITFIQRKTTVQQHYESKISAHTSVCS